MSSEWVGVIGTFLGAVAGGSIGYFATSAQIQHEKISDRNKRHRDMIQRAHTLLTEVAYKHGRLGFFVFRYLKFDVQCNVREELENIPITELSMIVDLYIPSLSDTVSKIHDKIEETSKIGFESLGGASKLSADTVNGYVDRIATIKLAVDSQCNSAKTVLVKQFRRLV